MILLLLCYVPANAADAGERKCGSEFVAYGLEGVPFSVALDVAGKIHNEYQESLLTQLASDGVTFNSVDELRAIIEANSISFFKPKGMDFKDHPFGISFAVGANDITFSPQNYSPQGLDIMNRLRDMVISYKGDGDPKLFERLTALREEALGLPDDKEVFTVGVPVSVAIYSFSYWQLNADRWSATLTQRYGGSDSAQAKIGLGQLGAADIGGAITGGFDGVVLGPGGAFAGAVLGSATASLGNLASQVMGHFFSWW